MPYFLILVILGLLYSTIVHGMSGWPFPSPTPSPVSISMDASRWNIQHSRNMPAHPSPVNTSGSGWQFDFPESDGVHYVVQSVSGKISGSFHVVVRTEASEGATFRESDPCGETHQPSMRLYFQRRGDTLTSDKPYHRWWSNPQHLPLAQGDTELTIPVDPAQWSSVFGTQGNANSLATAGFNAAVVDVQALGMTFGGCFFGHGAYVINGTGRLITTVYGLQ